MDNQIHELGCGGCGGKLLIATEAGYPTSLACPVCRHIVNELPPEVKAAAGRDLEKRMPAAASDGPEIKENRP